MGLAISRYLPNDIERRIPRSVPLTPPFEAPLGLLEPLGVNCPAAARLASHDSGSTVACGVLCTSACGVDCGVDCGVERGLDDRGDDRHTAPCVGWALTD